MVQVGELRSNSPLIDLFSSSALCPTACSNLSCSCEVAAVINIPLISVAVSSQRLLAQNLWLMLNEVASIFWKYRVASVLLVVT
uniref:Uncharacterized protein n=1 Tax=Physcomitrium patens TaxID=3218 RepID=A0A2K1JW39_PHYPA|nr:hypothetical protein PHYPA_015505 [Physcomitrium patens]